MFSLNLCADRKATLPKMTGSRPSSNRRCPLKLCYRLPVSYSGVKSRVAYRAVLKSMIDRLAWPELTSDEQMPDGRTVSDHFTSCKHWFLMPLLCCLVFFVFFLRANINVFSYWQYVENTENIPVQSPDKWLFFSTQPLYTRRCICKSVNFYIRRRAWSRCWLTSTTTWWSATTCCRLGSWWPTAAMTAAAVTALPQLGQRLQ